MTNNQNPLSTLTTNEVLNRFLDLAAETSRFNCANHLVAEQETLRLELIRRNA